MAFFGQQQNPSPAFPPATAERYYLPPALAYGTITPTRYYITYIPFFVKKNTSNLILCIEQTASGSQSIEAGIYDGSNGLPSASRLFSGTISTTGTGIFTLSSNLFFKAGYYITAGMVTSATPLQCRSMTLNAFTGADFGRSTSETAISTNYFFNQIDQTSLPSQIGTITMSAANAGANIFLRY